MRKQFEIEAIEAAQMAYETGHRVCSREDFSSDIAYACYLELMEEGPVGFYEEFANELDFDEMFIEEYGEEVIKCPKCGKTIDLEFCDTDKYWKEDKTGVENHIMIYHCKHCDKWFDEEEI